MKTFSNVLLIILFTGFTTFLGLYIFVTPDKETSDVENRSLAQKPELQLDKFANGEFTNEFDQYITDQFYARDVWIKGYLNWQLLTNQTFIYDYYIEDGWVYPKPFTTVDEDAIQSASQNMDELSQFAVEKGIELYLFSLPDRRHMLDFEYPNWVPESVGEQDKELFFSQLPEEGLHVVDVGERWKENGIQDFNDFYFRTDHHWNMYGAFAGYEVIHNYLQEHSDVFKEDAFSEKKYIGKCLDDKTFKGIYNQQLYGMINAEDEVICYYDSLQVDTDEWQTYVGGFNEESERPYNEIYARARHFEKESVSYSEAYTTDYSELHIINPFKEKTKVLVIKDSYANPLVPLIAENFYHTTFYDLRYNEGENLYDYIEKHDYDMIAILYSNGRTLKNLYEFK